MRTIVRNRFLAAVLGLIPAAFSTAHAAPASKVAAAETKVPAGPSAQIEARRAAMLAALAPALHEPLLAVVADAAERLRANDLAVAQGTAEPLDVPGVVRAALFDADFAGISKRKQAVVDAIIDLVVLQLAATLHIQLRDAIGRRQAVRAVRACGTEVACLDGIIPTATMTAEHISNIRKSFAGKATELASQDRLGKLEIQGLMTRYNQAETLQSSVLKKDADTMNAVISKI
jgi:hypothetical protein